MGLRKMVNRRSCKDLHRMIKVEVDGKLIDLPPVEGIIILNILRLVSIGLAGCLHKPLVRVDACLQKVLTIFGRKCKAVGFLFGATPATSLRPKWLP